MTIQTGTARFVDLSHRIEAGMITYPGLPAPTIDTFMGHDSCGDHYAPGTCFHIAEVRMVVNTGTYVDAPFHRYPKGVDCAQLPLEKVADLDALVIRVGHNTRAIDEERLEHLNVHGKAVLFHTGWDRYWGSERYAEGHPFLTERCARALIRGGAVLAGIDSLNIDDTIPGGPRPVHSHLLEAGIPIVEHLCRLDQCPDQGFRFSAVPIPFSGCGSFPVRAFARVLP